MVSSGGDIGWIRLDWVGFSWIGFDRSGTGFAGQFRVQTFQRQIEPEAVKQLGHFFAILAATKCFRHCLVVHRAETYVNQVFLVLLFQAFRRRRPGSTAKPRPASAHAEGSGTGSKARPKGLLFNPEAKVLCVPSGVNS